MNDLLKMENLILEKYREVYDTEHRVFRACGRNKCLELIKLCELYVFALNIPILNFGDTYGRVNLDNVQKLLRKFKLFA